MAQKAVKLLVPFESLVRAIAELRLEEKRKLWELLDEQIGQAEEDEWERDPKIQTEIQEARTAYESGDYVTIDEYITQRKKD
jgi:hypothetical protein